MTPLTPHSVATSSSDSVGPVWSMWLDTTWVSGWVCDNGVGWGSCDALICDRDGGSDSCVSSAADGGRDKYRYWVADGGSDDCTYLAKEVCWDVQGVNWE